MPDQDLAQESSINAKSSDERPIAVKGFHLIGLMNPRKREGLIAYATKIFKDLSVPSLEELQSLSELDVESAKALTLALTSAFSLTVGFAEQGIAAVVERAISMGWLSSDDSTVARDLITQLTPLAADVRRQISDRSRETDVVPDIEHLSASIDVRLGFRNGAVGSAQPVAIFHLKVERADSVIFKMTDEELGEVIGSLQEAQKNLRAALQWASERAQA